MTGSDAVCCEISVLPVARLDSELVHAQKVRCKWCLDRSEGGGAGLHSIVSTA